MKKSEVYIVTIFERKETCNSFILGAYSSYGKAMTYAELEILYRGDCYSYLVTSTITDSKYVSTNKVNKKYHKIEVENVN